MSNNTNSRKILILLVVIGVVLGLAFLLNNLYLTGGGESSEIVMPSETVSTPIEQESSPAPEDNTLSITPENVKNALGTVSRPVSYHSIAVITTNSQSIQRITQLESWVSEGSKRFDIDSGDDIKHIIISDDDCYIWYENKPDELVSFAVTEHFTPDDLQGIPSYEDVLDLPESRITDADYISAEDGTAGEIYVQWVSEDGNYTERYWISLETGLLTKAMTLYKGEAVYDMTQTLIEILPASHEEFVDRFTIPTE